MEQSAGMIKLMNQGLELMSDMNRKGGRRKATVGLTVRGLPKFNFQAALLQKQDPLALAYLADAQNHQAIFNTEWLTPSEKQAQAVAQLNAA